MAQSPWERRADPVGDWSDALRPASGRPALGGSRPLRITEVFPGSPAARAGIAPGWQLVRMRPAGGLLQPTRSRSPDENDIHVYPSLSWDEIVFDDDAGGTHLWQAPCWPFGLRLAPPLDKAFLSRVARQDIDRDIIYDVWKAGDLAAFAGMVGALRDAVAPSGTLKRLFAPREGDRIPGAEFEYHGFLALASAELGDLDAAEKAADDAVSARERLGREGFSGETLALELHARALVAIGRGATGQALEMAREAFALADDVAPLRELLWLLEGKPVTRTAHPLEGRSLGFDYGLPNRDPIGIWPGGGEEVTLSAALARCRPGRLLAISVLGGYRSNYYSNNDIARLAMIHRALPGILSEVHVIVSDDYRLSDEHRDWAESLARDASLPLRILWDEGDTIMQAIAANRSPQRYLLSHEGTVLSVDPWADESGVWAALARLGGDSSGAPAAS